ncbi:MAG: NADH-quinone oxidoreductase subunit NuoG [Chloroflexaceae bacterium]|nr:NADH-quinone oxidoreductase subunit NuoG [Chloroflexaceae bacterium]
MAEDITLIIDGVKLTVPEGTNVVDAARTVGIEIPVFCYHPRLRSVGMCRMCMVAVGIPRIDRDTGQCLLENNRPVISMFPRLQTACTTLVSPGMVVMTSTDEVKRAQRGILEFLLTSHPLDCPVCDKGGECPLQNLTMGWGPGTSRFEYHNKMHFEKPVPLGDLILLDRERCILCGRCVRFQDELADDPVLGFDLRGRDWHIISKSDPPFDSKFSGNTTDICPVGALTTTDFRFRSRVWELRSVPSLCIHCPVGCNVNLDMRHREVMRVMPRENLAVNDIWICDKGRFGQHFVESSERLTTPLMRRGDQLVQVSWEQAFETIAERFVAIQRKHGGTALAGIAGERLSNEDLYLFQRLFREVFGSNNLDHRIGTPGDLPDDDIGVMLGVGSGTSLVTLGKGTTVLVIGANPEEEAPVYLLHLHQMVKHGGELVVANVRPTKLDHSATLSLRYRPGTATQLVRGLLRVVLEEAGTKHLSQKTTGLAELRAALNHPMASVVSATGVSEDDIRAAAHTFLQAENAVIIYGAEAMAEGTALSQDLGSLALIAGKTGKANNGLLALLPWGNSRGVLDMGVRPDRGPGYAPLASAAKEREGAGGRKAAEGAVQRGLSAREMWNGVVEGRIRGMYLMGIDPASAYPATRTALEKVDFLVVQDMFLTPTAQMADVVLPAAAFAEREGTYTNAERRVQRVRPARPAPGDCRPDWAMVQGIAEAVLALLKGTDEEQGTAKEPRKKLKGKKREAPGGAETATESPGPSWGYLTASEVASEIAERVPGYQGIAYTRLANAASRGGWGRQPNESFYYGGTCYRNSEGVGIQYPAPAELSGAGFSLKPREVETTSASGGDTRYPFLVVTQRLLYDGDPFLRDSQLLAHVPAPYVAINPSDARSLGVQAGDRVRVASVAGVLELAARVSDEVPAGCVLIPSNLPGAPLSMVQTGLQTRVAVSKVGGRRE